MYYLLNSMLMPGDVDPHACLLKEGASVPNDMYLMSLQLLNLEVNGVRTNFSIVGCHRQ